MPHLSAVPDPDPGEYFTTIPVCPTCPAGSLGFWTTHKPRDWEVETWHEDPCPRAVEARTVTRVPGCPTCHQWHHADLSASSLIAGRWAFIPQHGRTPLTSRDGTASGGEYCPQLEADTAVIDRLARRQDGG